VTAGKWRGILIAMFLFASATEFCIRGPVRLLQDGSGWNDFLSTYIQAKAWGCGKDPYSPQSLIALWPSDNHRPLFVDAAAANGQLERKAGVPSPYPLTSLVLLSPFTLFSWSVALRWWIALNVCAVVLACFALVSICGCSLAEFRSQVFLGCAFALAPFHSGLGTANPAMLAVSLTVGCVWVMHSHWEKTAGVLLALAICLKPSVAGGLLLFFLIRRRWKVSMIATAGIALVGAVGAIRLAVSRVPWFFSYLENSRRIFAPGSVDDFTPANPIRFNMVNAQVPIYSLIGNAALANLAALFLAAIMLGCWLWFSRRHRSSDVLAISFISVVSLIAVYHRFYDAALLIWPLAWSLLAVRKRSTSLAVLLLIVPFFLPGAAVLDRLAVTGHIPRQWLNGWFWNDLVMPHEAWVLILLTILLLHCGRSIFPEEPDES
jgi:glycosyl transferase family 87